MGKPASLILSIFSFGKVFVISFKLANLELPCSLLFFIFFIFNLGSINKIKTIKRITINIIKIEKKEIFVSSIIRIILRHRFVKYYL